MATAPSKGSMRLPRLKTKNNLKKKVEEATEDLTNVVAVYGAETETCLHQRDQVWVP